MGTVDKREISTDVAYRIVIVLTRGVRCLSDAWKGGTRYDRKAKVHDVRYYVLSNVSIPGKRCGRGVRFVFRAS